MKKYILVIILSIISLVNFNLANAQVSEVKRENDTCKDTKKVGDACSYESTTQNIAGTLIKSTIKGFCDRSTADPDPKKNPLVCKKGDDWGDCVVEGDACLEKGKTGTCVGPTCTRIRGCQSAYCDTNKTPPGNPGGSTPATCDGKTCPSNQVCANQGGKPTCTANAASSDGKCDGKTCTPNQICINQGNPPKPTCTANASTPGTPANTNPTDATAPQTVGFINPIRFNSLTELIAGIINALLGILGAITVGVLVYSGFQYMISSDPGAVGKALDGIKNAIVGLMIIMGAFLITQYVISALAGSSTAPPPPNSPPDNSNQNPPNPAPKPAPNPAPNPEKCGGKTCKPNEGCLEDASGNPTCISCDFLGC